MLLLVGVQGGAAAAVAAALVGEHPVVHHMHALVLCRKGNPLSRVWENQVTQGTDRTMPVTVMLCFRVQHIC